MPLNFVIRQSSSKKDRIFSSKFSDLDMYEILRFHPLFKLQKQPLYIFLFHWAFTFTQFSIGKYHAIRIENYNYFTQLLI